MSGPAPIFREVHRLRRHETALQEDIDRGPRLLKAHQAKLAAVEGSLAQGHEAIKKLKVQMLEKESQLKGVQQVIAKHEKQRNEATSKKEYDALNAEIGSEKRKITAIEDDILEILGKIEEQTAKIPEFEKTLEKAKADFAELEKGAAGRADDLRQELEKTKAQLQQVEAALPDDASFRSVYNRVVQSKGADALAGIVGRTCTACYTEITAQNLHDLTQEKFVMCKSCGRALYLAD